MTNHPQTAAVLLCTIVAAGCGGSEITSPPPGPGSAATSIDPSRSTTDNGTGNPSDPSGPASPSGSLTSKTPAQSSDTPSPTRSGEPPDPGGSDDNVGIGPSFTRVGIKFGAVTVHTSKTRRVSLTNATHPQQPGGAFTLRITDVVVDGGKYGAFTKSADACTNKVLGVGESCEFSITFRPPHVGPFNGPGTCQDERSDSGGCMHAFAVSSDPSLNKRKSASERLLGTGVPSTHSTSQPPVKPPTKSQVPTPTASSSASSVTPTHTPPG